jgi:FMN phosphatase YigB (HAD superfamily)
MTRPTAVLLDSGGIFLLPDHERVGGALARSEVPVSPDVLDRAHYLAAAHFTVALDVEGDWAGCWHRYLEVYVAACEVPTDRREEVHRHLDSEFADAGLWSRVVPGSADGLRRLADAGVRLGVVSNADGLMGARLRETGILQVGPGTGVPVECVIDSGDVGVMKPDPRIFRIALDAMDLGPDECWYVGDMPGIDVVGARRAGLRPFAMDPLHLHHRADYDRVGSLAELADRITGRPTGTGRLPTGLPRRLRQPTREGERFTVAGAARAAESGELAQWVGEFLASRGSDNAVLAAALAAEPHWWLGPVRVPLTDLHRLAGPEDDALCAIDPTEWEDDTSQMAASIDAGWEPPPLLAEHREGRLLLQDGNHRYEALRRSGAGDAWVIIWFDEPEGPEGFARRHPDLVS